MLSQAVHRRFVRLLSAASDGAALGQAHTLWRATTHYKSSMLQRLYRGEVKATCSVAI